MITVFYKFPDEATAKAQLAAFVIEWPQHVEGEDIVPAGWTWNRALVDGPITVRKPTGNILGQDEETGANIPEMEEVPGYHLNVGYAALPSGLALNPSFLGARDESGEFVLGDKPENPTRVFA